MRTATLLTWATRRSRLFNQTLETAAVEGVRFVSRLQREVDVNKAAKFSRDVTVPKQLDPVDNISFEEISLEQPIYGQDTVLKADIWTPTVAETIANAYALSKEQDALVFVPINDVDVAVSARSLDGELLTADEATSRAQAYYERSRRNQANAKSPEGKALAAAFEQHKINEQHAADRLVADLPRVIAEGQDAIVAWVGEFAVVNDAHYIRFDAEAVARQLEGTGLGALDSDAIPQENRIPPMQLTNRDLLAETLVTKAISSLRGDFARVHPASGDLAKRYAELPACSGSVDNNDVSRAPPPTGKPRRRPGMNLMF